MGAETGTRLNPYLTYHIKQITTEQNWHQRQNRIQAVQRSMYAAHFACQCEQFLKLAVFFLPVFFFLNNKTVAHTHVATILVMVCMRNYYNRNCTPQDLQNVQNFKPFDWLVLKNMKSLAQNRCPDGNLQRLFNQFCSDYVNSFSAIVP